MIMTGISEINKHNILIITHLFANARSEISVNCLIKIFEPLCKNGYIITGNYDIKTKINLIAIKNNSFEGVNIPPWTRIVRYIILQLKITYKIFLISKNIDIVIFHFGSRFFLLPLLFSKLLRKKIIVFSFGSAAIAIELIEKNKEDPYKWSAVTLPKIMNIFEQISFSLSDKIIVESENIIEFAKLRKYKHKISKNYASPEFIDVDLFRIRKCSKNKMILVGYIGRLSEEKGVMNFVKSIPIVTKNKKDVEFLVGGSGPLLNEIEKELKNNGSYLKTHLTNWIPHDQIPNYLNELKLLIIPSFTEGLPGLLREAMSCGTPVLATPVGSIPDLIKDGVSGFIMENNTPECIAENIARVLERSDLDKIAANARKIIENEYTYKATIEKYKKILNEF